MVMIPKFRIRLKAVLQVLFSSIDVNLLARCRGTETTLFRRIQCNICKFGSIIRGFLTAIDFGVFFCCPFSETPKVAVTFRRKWLQNCICMLSRHQNIDFRRIQWENWVFGKKIGDFFKTTVFGNFFGRFGKCLAPTHLGDSKALIQHLSFILPTWWAVTNHTAKHTSCETTSSNYFVNNY